MIEVLAPDCAGAEVACNDDFIGLQSEVVVALQAGETVIVVVDGYNANAGDYQLTID